MSIHMFILKDGVRVGETDDRHWKFALDAYGNSLAHLPEERYAARMLRAQARARRYRRRMRCRA